MSKVYEKITAQILESLEVGTVPWRQTWKGGFGGAPRNLISGYRYRGINAFTLMLAGFESPLWLTYKQAKDLGGQVMKGQKGRPIIFFKMLERENAKGKAETFPMARQSTVFNVAQCEGLNHKRLQEIAENATQGFDPIERAETIAAGYVDGPTVQHCEARAFYRPKADCVNMPKPEAFESSEEYYSTLFHELGHSTGHASRLNRSGIADAAAFGDHRYSEEELIAEMCAAFLCGHAGIEAQTLENSAAYLQHWIKTLEGDSKLIVRAASAAQKAADRILGDKAEKRTKGEQQS